MKRARVELNRTLTYQRKAMAGAPIGNNNAVKNKLWIDTLRRVITQDRSDRVRKAAEKLLDSAAEGEQWAIKELADRLDGKPAQSKTLDFFGENQITKMVVTWSDAQSMTQTQSEL